MDLPLKADFFPQVRLTADERSKYARIVDTSATALRRSVDSRDWVKLYDKDGVAFSKMHCIDDQQARTATAPTGATACLAVCATIFTPGTISEVLEAIASPVTEDYRKAMAFVYRERFLDAVALHTLTPSAPQAFTTIKWAAFDDGKAHNSAKFPLGSDYCYLEHSGIRTLDSGGAADTFGFSLQESIVREREVPSLAGFGLRRGEFHRTGIVVLPTERRDVVQVSSILQMRLLGSDSAANKAALERLMLKRVAAVGRIDVLLERRRLSKMQFVHRDEWVADEDRKACAVCVKPFSIRRRHHCRNCGEVVCSTCAPPREVDVSNFGSALIRICTACVVQARTEPHQAAHTPSSHTAADVFVYHVRSSFSSSDASDDGDAVATAPRDTTRPRAFSSDSNFSIASEYPQPPPPLYQHHHHQSQHYGHYFEHQQLTYHHRDAPDDADAYYARASQASSDDSSYSFSDLNTFDDRFGSVALKRLAPQSLPLPPAHRTASHVRPSRDQLFHEAPERAAFTPSKVMTHLLTRSVSDQSGRDDDDNAVHGELSRSFVSTGSLDADFDACIRGLQDDISRATTTRVSDLAPGESFCSDLTNFHCEDRQPLTATRSTSTLSLHSTSAPPRVSASSSSPSTVDADIELLLLHDDFSLLCPDTLQRQQQRASSVASVHQDAGEEQRRRGSVSPAPVSAPAPALPIPAPAPTVQPQTPAPSASAANDDSGDHADDATERLASHADLLALRRQVEGLHKSLEDATNKLQYYQLRAAQGPRTQRAASTESDASSSSSAPAAPVAPLPVDSSRRTRRRGSGTTSASKDTRAVAPASVGRRPVGRQDRAFVKRTETYDALVSELHELMGLPTLSPHAAPCS